MRYSFDKAKVRAFEYAKGFETAFCSEYDKGALGADRRGKIPSAETRRQNPQAVHNLLQEAAYKIYCKGVFG